MSALPTPERPAYSPYRLEADQGPQTVAELRAQLTAVSPADRETFEADLASARLDEVPAVITRFRHVWALRTRPEVQDAIRASVAGTAALVPVDLSEDADR